MVKLLEVDVGNQKDLSWTIHFRAPLGDGSIVTGMCAHDMKDVVVEALSNVKDMKFALTKEIKGSETYGCYGELTRFDIKRHLFGSGGYECFGWFSEILEIKDSEGRCPFVKSEWATGEGYSFNEYDSLEDALYDWNHKLENSSPLSKRKRFVECKIFKPWFYALREQAIWGKDFVFPESDYDDAVFRPFKAFVIEDRIPSFDPDSEEKIRRKLKICLGVRLTKHEGKPFRVVLWHDGTFSDEYNGFSDIFPAETKDLLEEEAILCFKRILAGDLQEMRVVDRSKKEIIYVRSEKIPRGRYHKVTGPQKKITGRKIKGAFIEAGEETIIVGKDKSTTFVFEKKQRNKSGIAVKEEGEEEY